MTRLGTADVRDIPTDLHAYDAELNRKTGGSLRDLACHAAQMAGNGIADESPHFRMGVIPVTSGKGVISGFSEAVCAIVSHLGFEAFVTNGADVAGLAEAFEKGAHGILMADDRRFVAIHMESRRVIYNETATARGYVAGLDLMTGGLRGRNVAVIGCGPVGSAAMETAIDRGAVLSVFDVDSTRCRNAVKTVERSWGSKIKIRTDFESLLYDTNLIIDATPAGNIIHESHIGSGTFIAAPGVPLGLDSKACTKIGARLLHDPLQIGVATMAMLAFKAHLCCRNKFL